MHKNKTYCYPYCDSSYGEYCTLEKKNKKNEADSKFLILWKGRACSSLTVKLLFENVVTTT